MTILPPTDPDEMLGAQVLDADGGSLGTVERVLPVSLDGTALVIIEPGFLGSTPLTAIVSSASFDGVTVRLPFSRDMVEAAPAVDPATLNRVEEAELRAYYGPTGGVPAEGSGVSGLDVGAVVVRSEEHLEASTTLQVSGQARLRKVVVEEEQTIVVRLRRETLVLETTPLAPDAAGADVVAGGTEIDLEVRPDGQVVFETTLYQEEAVVSTVVVPVERVSLRVHTVLEEETVTAPVRIERVEADETYRS